ncbi:MAG: hypothetical protein N2512_00200 [Armatimonadetes bacterium]|nr:hypothetical protein [Armatimonadota bacterium]
MRQRLPVVLLASTLATLCSGPRVPAAAGATVISVTDFGATGDGVTDDRPAIQAALDALAAKGGGTLRIPKGTYLLDSYKPAVHPWGFYNLLVGSNIHIEGEPGATLLQGPKGRAPLPPGADYVVNAVLVVGTPLYAVVTFQNTDFNGGFHPLHPTETGKEEVRLTDAADSAHFAPGDYVAIYATTTGDVLPTEVSRVTEVSADGLLKLAFPLARSFAEPKIANVTRLMTCDVSLKNLTIQGAIPLTVMETFGFSAENCLFLADTNIPWPNVVTVFGCNTMRAFRFVGNEIGSVGPGYVGIELPQRNSQDGLFERNTVRAISVGFGEYGAHWQFLDNRFFLYPRPETAVAISITGLDVTFSRNYVHCGKLTGGEGWGSVLTDFYAPGDYAPYIGQIRITDNTIECELGGAYCIRTGSRDPVIAGNRLTVRGPGAAIRLDGEDVTASVTDNDINVDVGTGIMLETYGNDRSTVARNKISATNGTMGIHIAWPSKNRRVEDNTITGFAQDVVLEHGK